MTVNVPPEGWERNVWALSLCVFIAFVGFQFFSPFLPLYIRELGVTEPAKIALWSGLLAAVTPTVSGLLSPVFGRLADRFGRKIMLIRSLAGFTVIIALMGLLVAAQFIDRGLSLLIPLQVAHMPGVEAAATSGFIISVAAVGGAISATAGARLAQGIAVGRLLFVQLLLGGVFCVAMALA